ncbi:MAG: tRNA (N6-isopentenyl adenosine(37)-C2)-methylthiotransferase MiaB [Lentisphaerae bacterium]|nr:tRNA (N6-isopentenyl adenosine(37)-C2)-methylthiotransferase MiaB [Lentisphaerota bacterium]
MKFHIKTYGCQMNERDSEEVAMLLARSGHAPASCEAEADAIVVNTCSVREKAEVKALGKIRMLLAAKREQPARIVGVMGCMAQRLGESLVRRLRGLDFVVGTQRLAAIPAILDAVRAGKGPIVDCGERRLESEASLTHRAGGHSALVNILLGCDRRCSYCVVPLVRGREWSRPACQVLEEVGALVRHGVRDITLLGQSVMSYGAKQSVWEGAPASPGGYREPFPRLLEAVNAIPGLKRLRFMSGHPSGCTEELVRAMAELPAVCEHLHLPVQSGSDRILKRMNRGYTLDDYREAVRRIRARIPAAAVTTDIIVGFPSETPAEFEETRRFMDEIGFDNAFIFKYAPREGTTAAEWKDDVSADEKMRRNKILLEEQNRRSLQINEKQVGCDCEVRVEGVSRRTAARWTGLTRTAKSVMFEPFAGIQEGDSIRVGIERAMPQTLYGSVRLPGR